MNSDVSDELSSLTGFPPNQEPAAISLMLASIRDFAVAMLSPEGLILSWNPGAEAITGYAAAEIVGQPVAQLYAPEESAIGKPARDLQASLKDGRFEETGFRVRKDGAFFQGLTNLSPMRDPKGQAMGFVLILRDVSQRMEAREKLQAREAHQRSLVDTLIATVSDAVVTLTESGTVQSANAGVARLFGRPITAVVGRNIKTFIAPAFHQDFDRHLRDVHVDRTAHGVPRSVAGLRADGALFPVEFAIGEATVGGEAIFVGVIRDISEAATLREKLAEARKGEAVGDLAGGIAHDFNNLLTVMLGGAEDLAASLDAQPDLKRHADVVRTAAERGAELTQRLLAYSRQGAATAVHLDVNQVLRAMRQLLRRTLRADVELRFDLAESLHAAIADAVTFETAIIAAVRRAQSVMPAGGRLTVSTCDAAADAFLTKNRPTLRSGAYVTIALIDSSATAAGSEGLAAVAEFVGSSSGFLDVTHDVTGNAVRISLPVAEGAKPVAVETARTDDEARSGLVLLAEDDPFVRSYAVACLESLGYSVVAAVDGRDALSRLAQGLNPDILFTDIVMPGGVNGWELAAQALAQRPALKVLYTSGYALETLAETGTLPPGARVLHKPYRRAELGRQMQELMGEIARPGA